MVSKEPAEGFVCSFSKDGMKQTERQAVLWGLPALERGGVGGEEALGCG